MFMINTSQKFTETSNNNGYILSATVGSTTKYINMGSLYTHNSSNTYYLTTSSYCSSAITFRYVTPHFETLFIYNHIVNSNC